MLDFAIFAVTVIITLIVAIMYLYSGTKKLTTIPGPEAMDSLEGNLPDIKSCGSLHEFLRDIHEAYGDIASFSFGPQLCVSIASPELFKEQSKVFDRPAELFQAFSPLITDDCIQFANGGEGRKRHAAYARCFSDDAMKKYYPTFQKLSEKLARDLALTPKEQHIAIKSEMFKFAISSMMKTAFGSYFEDEKAVASISRSYEFTWDYLERTVIADTEVISPATETMFEKHKDNLYDIMGKALHDRENNPPKSGDKMFVDVLLELGMSERTIVADALVLLIASFHTTGLLLTWGLYYICENPKVLEKLQKELNAVLGEKGKVTPENIDELVYMRQVLNETLRCSILAPFAARVQEFDVELGGHRVPAGTPVVHALGVLSQNEELYPDPEKFDPDRFAPEKLKGMPSFSFEPFGFAGKRKCMGYKFSLVEATVLLSVLLQKLNLKLIPDQAVSKVFGLVTKPKEDIWFTVSSRK